MVSNFDDLNKVIRKDKGNIQDALLISNCVSCIHWREQEIVFYYIVLCVLHLTMKSKEFRKMFDTRVSPRQIGGKTST